MKNTMILPQGYMTMSEMTFKRQNPYYTKVKFYTQKVLANPLCDTHEKEIVAEYLWVKLCDSLQGFSTNSTQDNGFGIVDNVPEYLNYVKLGDKILYKTVNERDERPTFISVITKELTKYDAEALLGE
jgi:hypothetical protein